MQTTKQNSKFWERILPLLLVAVVFVDSYAVAENSVRQRRRRTPTRANTAQAQTTEGLAPAPTVDVKSLLNKTLTEVARETLERYIPLKEFQVIVSVTPTQDSIPVTPYDPGSVVATRNLDDLAKYVKRIDVEVLLTTRLRGSRNRIRSLIENTLEFKKGRGDKVRFGELGIEIVPEAWQQEKNELKTDMSRIKTENDRLSRELARSQQNEGFLGKYTQWAIIGVVGGVILIVLTGLMMASRSVFVLGRNLGSSVTAIASSLESVGTSIQAAAGIAPSDSGPRTLEARMITDGKKGGGGGGMANLPMESIHAHMMKMRHDLLENMNEGTEGLMLRHLTNQLSNPATVEKAVVTMELIGRDMATELFKRLGMSSQEAILRFMREGGYEGSKVELMLEAGEELKTKILVDSLDMARGRPSEKVAEKVLQLTDDDLALIANELQPEYLPRLFLYLDATKIAGILSEIKSANPKGYSSVLALLSKLPEAETANNHDQEISRVLDSAINQTKSDAQRPFLKVYKEIIEAAEDDLSEEIVRQLSADPRLDQYFQENVITARTLFRLKAEARNEIVQNLSNKDVAALAIGCREDERKIIMQALPARRKGMIAEEYESLTARGGRQSKYAYNRVRDVIVKKLKDMKDQGTLSASIDKAAVKPKQAEAPKGGGAFGGGAKKGIGAGSGGGAAKASPGFAANKAGAARPMDEMTGSISIPGAKPIQPDTKGEKPKEAEKIQPPPKGGSKKVA